MSSFLIDLDPSCAALYRKIGESMGLPTERVLSDALFKLAGELSMQAIGRDD